ncbi:MAG: FG-GAP repeat domain-containing protein [Candidatus Methylacidiphilales bacterium]
MVSIAFVFFSGLFLTSEPLNNDFTTRLGPRYIVPSGDVPVSLVAGDLNHDGKDDVVVLYDSKQVQSFISNGDGSFQSYQKFPVTTFSSEMQQFLLEDFDGDGNLDIVYNSVRHYSSSSSRLHGWSETINVLPGKGNGTFEPQPVATQFYDFSQDQYQNSSILRASDINKDGKTDLLVLMSYGDFKTMSSSPSAAIPPESRLELKHDSSSRLVVVPSSPDQPVTPAPVGYYLLVFLARGNGKFEKPIVYRQPFSDNIEYIPADINNDGFPDLVLFPPNQNKNYYVLLGKGDGSFTPTSGMDVPYTFPPLLVDVNKDGRQDLLCYNSTNMMMHAGNGDGTFLSNAMPVGGAKQYPYHLIQGDFNGDGYGDYAMTISHPNAPHLFFYLAKKDGTFHDPQEVDVKDIYMVGQRFTYSFDFRNWRIRKIGIPFHYSSRVPGDFNGDGKTDVAVCNPNRKEWRVLLCGVPPQGIAADFRDWLMESYAWLAAAGGLLVGLLTFVLLCKRSNMAVPSPS